jgi:autoinducer 2 (AI-2) kinase
MGQAFSSLRGSELAGRTVGLVGLGAVGRAVARRLRGFGARVLAHDPQLDAERAALADAEWVALDELLSCSDVVSLHAPASDATRGLVGARELARMPKGAWLVNTARAGLVDEPALVDALRGGRLAGAAIDVFAVEPPGSDHPLLALPNVIATPHVAGNTHEVGGHQGRIVAEDLARLLRGERPLHALNPEALDGFDWNAPRPAPDRARLAALAGRPGPAVSDLQRDARPATAPPKLSRFRPAPGEAPAPVADPSRGETRARMQALLADWVERCLADDSLQRAAQGRDVTLHFTLTDLDLAFWLRLRETLSGSLGSPDGRPEVDLRLRADVLDGMFTGRVNPMQAAMQGRLSFTGDAAKAMTLQHLQADLARTYRASREAVGDPGDLAALAAPGSAPAAAAEDDDVRVELVRVVHELYAQQLITATGGNVSARVPGRDEAWITPSQLFKGELRPDMLVRIDLDGTPLDAGAPSPSSERLMHCAVYRARPEATAVVHAHAPHATILANSRLPFLPISTEAAFFGELPRVPFIMPGTAELAKAVEEAARGSWAVLLVNHGLLVAGRSLRRAADMAEIVERSSEVILGCHAVGRTPPTLPDDVVAELRRMGDLVA